MKKNHLIDEKLSKLISQSSDFWAWEIDLDGKYIYISKNVEKILGYKPDEMVGMYPSDFMLNEDGKRFSKNFETLKQNEDSFWNLTISFYSKDGQIIEFKMSGIPKYDESDNFCGYKGINYLNKISPEKEPGDPEQIES
jgi:PAS domain S-box-containing protein